MDISERKRIGKSGAQKLMTQQGWPRSVTSTPMHYLSLKLIIKKIVAIYGTSEHLKKIKNSKNYFSQKHFVTYIQIFLYTGNLSD